jgi:putative ABC transport system permease protein
VEITRLLRQRHRTTSPEDDDFTVRTVEEMAATRVEMANTMTMLLMSVASVSLLVGGIGIMNIMLVSVTERTREIGIRKALGATRSNIMMQFLIEAMVLSFVGGTLGILLGTGAAITLSRLAGWNTYVSPMAIMVAFVFSAGVGLFFGILPARRAASLDPIVALRYE